MELKLNSWHVWLYNYTFNSKLPDSLCPYFWKLVLALLLFPINVVLRLPVYISFLFIDTYKDEYSERTGSGIFLWFLIVFCIFAPIAIYHNILWWFNAYSYNNDLAICGGFLLIIIAVIIIAVLNENNDIAYNIKYKAKNNILVNYSKAWYNNYCPKINWK